MCRHKNASSSVNANIRDRVAALETNYAGRLTPPSWQPMPAGPFVGRRVEFILNEGRPGESVAADIVHIREDAPPGEVVLRLVLDTDTYHQGIHPVVGWASLGNEPGCWRPLEHERKLAPPAEEVDDERRGIQ